MGINDQQPAPLDTNNPPVWEVVLADMRARDASGRAKYGKPLTAGNGRDQLVDAYQEVLDLAVYLRAFIIEREQRKQKLEECFAFMRKDGNGLTKSQEDEMRRVINA